jgi:hypothetical protein
MNIQNVQIFIQVYQDNIKVGLMSVYFLVEGIHVVFVGFIQANVSSFESVVYWFRP